MGFTPKPSGGFATGERPKTEKYWRIINELPFVLMIGAAILAMVKPF